MKKLVFTAIAVLAFSGVQFAGTEERKKDLDLIPPDPCLTAAFVEATLVKEDHESAGLGCLTSSEWNAVYNTAYNECKAQ